MRYLCYSFKVYHGCYQALLLSQQTSHTSCMAGFFFFNVENFVRKSLKTYTSHGWANNHDHLHLKYQKLTVGCCTEELLEWFDILTYKHPPAIQSYLHHDFPQASFSAKPGQSRVTCIMTFLKFSAKPGQSRVTCIMTFLKLHWFTAKPGQSRVTCIMTNLFFSQTRRVQR